MPCNKQKMRAITAAVGRPFHDRPTKYVYMLGYFCQRDLALLIELKDCSVFPDESQPVALVIGGHGTTDHAVGIGDVLFQIVHLVGHMRIAVNAQARFSRTANSFLVIWCHLLLWF